MKNTILIFILTTTLLISSQWSKTPISPVKRFGGDQLVNPHKIIASNGEIYVIEPKMSRIVIFTPAGEFKMSLGRAGEGPLEFKSLVFFTISHEMIYCFDGLGNRLSLFSQKNKNFLKYITLDKTVDNFPPSKMIIHPDGTMIFLNNGLIKEHKLIGLYNPEGKRLKQILNAYPAYQSMSEKRDDKDPNSHAMHNFFKNAGFIAISNGKLYYANVIENQVTELDMNGKVLNRFFFPLPSHEKIFRLVPISKGPNGAQFNLENLLNYDLKSVDNIIHILCRDNGLSFIFRLVKGKFEEVCRMKEQLAMFDIMDNKIYAVEEEPDDEDKGTEILVYTLPKN
jgi:hypothetical protein